MSKQKAISARFLVNVFIMAAITTACGIKTEPELKNLLKATVKNCDFGDGGGYKHDYGWKIEKCTGEETKKTSAWIKKNGVARSIPTLVSALGERDDKMASTAVYHFNWDIGLQEGPIAKDPNLLPDKVSRLMITNFKQRLSETWIQYAARPVTRLAVIKGLDSEIIAIASSLPDTSPIKHSIYANLMVYGGMKNYETLKALTNSSNNTIALAGIRGPSSLIAMDEPAKSILCPWWETFLTSADPYKSAASAAQLGNYCSGKSIDAMFDTIEKRLSAIKDVKKLEADFIWAVRFLSCEKNLLNSTVRGNEVQCKRKQALKKIFDKR